MPHGLAERAVPLVPLSSSPIELGYLARALAPQFQAQHRGEQRVVTVPPVPDRADERIRLRQRRQYVRRLFIIVELAGEVCGYLVQDARPYEKVPDGGGL